MLTERSGRIREAHKLTRRAGRNKSGLLLAEGAQAVREGVAAGKAVEVFVTSAARERCADIVEQADQAGVPTTEIDDTAAAALSETVTPQGIVATCRSLVTDLDAGLPATPRLVVVLAQVRDPGNVGTMIRCADAAGADAVVLTAGSADPESGKAIRASVGSVFHLPIVMAASVTETVSALHERGAWVVAADGTGDLNLDEVQDNGQLAKPTAWVFGNEAWGLPPDVLALADRVIRIPIYGQAESLNVASAAAVCLYTSARAQRS